MWKTIGSMPEVDEPPPKDLVQRLKRIKKAFENLHFMASRDVFDHAEVDLFDTVDDILAEIHSPKCDRDTLLPLIQSLRKLIAEGGLPPPTITVDYLTSGPKTEPWARAVPLQKLREDAIQLRKSKLGSRVGRRCRDAALYYLANGLGVAPDAPTLDWLRSFNWKVVKELEKCSA